MVRDADRSATAKCRFVGIVQGTSSQTGTANAETGYQNARNEAREHAAELGADYVVWTEGTASFMAIVVQAEAYRCP